MNIIATIHRYLGETMLLIALIGIILAIIGLIRKKELDRAENILAPLHHMKDSCPGPADNRSIGILPSTPLNGAVDSAEQSGIYSGG